MINNSFLITIAPIDKSVLSTMVYDEKDTLVAMRYFKISIHTHLDMACIVYRDTKRQIDNCPKGFPNGQLLSCRKVNNSPI